MGRMKEFAMSQAELDFISQPVARRSDPETSHQAARDATFKASDNCLKALNHLSQKPMTDFELAAVTGMQQNSIGKRRGDCAKAGLVEPLMKDGKVVKRPAPSGSLAIVWTINDDGLLFLLGS